MNKALKIVSISLLLCITLSVLTSCNKNETLEVNSDTFQTLKSTEPDAKLIKNFHFDYSLDYVTYSLNEIDGEIYLEEYKRPSTHGCILGNRYLIGLNFGEYDGWVAHSEFDEENNYKPIYNRILKEICIGIEESPFSWENNNKPYVEVAYIFTGLGHLTTNKGKIYRYESRYPDYEQNCLPI